MFDWLSSVLANLAYDAAIKSVDVASHNGCLLYTSKQCKKGCQDKGQPFKQCKSSC